MAYLLVGNTVAKYEHSLAKFLDNTMTSYLHTSAVQFTFQSTKE